MSFKSSNGEVPKGTPIEHVMLVCIEVNGNHNKFWEGKLYSNGVCARWGRVGSTSTEDFWPTRGGSYFNSQIRDKTGRSKEPYTKVALAAVTESTQGSGQAGVAATAKRDIDHGGHTEVIKLLEDLAAINAHEIFEISGGRLKVNAAGAVETGVGIVSSRTIDQARPVLSRIHAALARGFSADHFIPDLEQYLTLIPQKVGGRAGWHLKFLPDIAAAIRQADFLDQLEASIPTTSLVGFELPKEKQFDFEIVPLADKTEIARITKYYESTKQSRHSSSSLKVKRIFKVCFRNMAKDFEEGKKIGNICELWHGTRTHNLLSLFSKNVLIPRQTDGIHINGRNFGNGFYMSDQSTKSANYSYGFWEGARDRRCFMLLVDAALGKQYIPLKSGEAETWNRPPVGYDSVFGKPGLSGPIINNEFIVYQTNRVNPKYLVEFYE